MATLRLSSPDAAAQWLRARVRGALVTDHRRVRPGDGFVAWPGRRVDARQFARSALAAGAAACLVEHDGADAFAFDDERIATLPGLKAAAGVVADAFHGHPSAVLDVVAATGTNGKTSTAWWTAQALTALGRRCALVGTLGIGEPPRIGAADGEPPRIGAAGGEPPHPDTGAPAALETTGLTTPDAVQLHAALRRFVDAGFAACAMEASSIGLDEHRLAGVRIAVALFSNLTRDHLDHHGTMQAYGEAKRRLFAWPGLRAAVVNVDDPFGARLADELRREGRLDLWTCSTQGAARLAARDLRYAGDGLAFDVVEDGVAHPVASTLIGSFNVANVLLVVGALRALGVPLADAAAVVPELTPVPGRMERVLPPDVDAAAMPEVVVDYAHTPDALEKVLVALRPLAAARGGRLWCVFGCGGNRDATKRAPMGAVAERLADVVVLTSDNPRGERPGAILEQIAAGLREPQRARVIEDRAAAIAAAVGEARACDVVLLAGKGHEDYQEVDGTRRPFSDLAEAERALRARATGAAR
ncbi:UDP-N-acetylmuramoyl-L-alanyl-D-glutamate--2,6-diaminopimelate ligase [Calidifontimicrobium sp. SYSU G02091]|uniref:Mur ligase family protein n=1 Tax=Calidifontimicrobium sp. SYSU G02091 TaxID=2926421 RepID=UPI001F5394F6|nr:UDP-N-acetylmuramoyl-L-alanyl-D-glutamate--2,6-diaminopimelate ligase [Calidifontimicrobium sp. SYSU G02091]MCI1193181.1 UDP-N-acetylmuramoyl-L-alanyl-D-glutamate--2,6-diaminopimelate ligase [Calidifontimicrobium sp. SYSU G02091]